MKIVCERLADLEFRLAAVERRARVAERAIRIAVNTELPGCAMAFIEMCANKALAKAESEEATSDV